MRVNFRSTAAALALGLALATPAGAAEPAAADLKAEIEGFLDRLEKSSDGLIRWDGADRMEFRRDGDRAIADIGNARISIAPDADKPTAERARIVFDHIEIRRAPGPEGTTALSFVLPAQSVLHSTDGGETRLTLKDATADAIIEAKSSRTREIGVAVAGARLEDRANGNRIAFGPLSLSSKIVGTADGGWTAPSIFELKGVTFSFADGPVEGAIDRIAYDGSATGSDLAAFNRFRDRLEALREAQASRADASPDAMLELLPDLVTLFGLAKGEFTLEGLAARPPTGEPFVTLKKASMGGALTGLSGEKAALRVTVRHDGLSIAPGLVDAGKVPQRAVFDVGLEDMGTEALRSILDALGKMREGASDTDKEKAEQQMMAAAAMLTPVLRIHELALDTPDIGVAATGEAKGSPLSMKGFSAAADVTVRGFAALAGLVGDAPLVSYLPLLQEIGTTATAADGTKRIQFHLASAPQKWITLNGSDVSAWFAGNDTPPGKARDLRPADPAMTGEDVRAVQQALAAARIDTPQNGAYDGATAVAVARFQKANALNVDGVVDAATRQRLGVKTEPAAPKPAPARPGSR
ncbi:MAG TPA: peptidoglycan-binding domain-containing protein [Stellaceae bacterium]|nr:peptidoglycan-binding domain-containing protein [Stellaceae bacterium]